MRNAIAIGAVSAACFGAAFAAGATTRSNEPTQPAPALRSPEPVRVAGLASAPALPGLKVVAPARKRVPAKPGPATVASAPARPAATAPVRVVAQTRPAPTTTAHPPAAEPTAAASGPSTTFFDDGQ
jgi:hypothetical protein